MPTFGLDLGRPYGNGGARKLRTDSLDDLETLANDPDGAPRSSAAGRVDLGCVVAEEVGDLGVENGVERVEFVGEHEVVERSGTERRRREGVGPGAKVVVVG